MAGVGTTTTTAAALKQYWQNFFIENFYENEIFSGLTKKTKVGKGNGKVVWWIGISKVSPVGASLTEGADPTATSSAATRISATLTEYGKLVKNSRLFMDTAIDGVKEQIIKGLAKDASVLNTKNILTAALAGVGATVRPGTVAARNSIAAANTCTLTEVRKVVRLLELSSVLKFADGFYVGIIHPDTKYDLQTDSAWQDIVRYRDSVQYDIKGEVGRIYGVRFMLAPYSGQMVLTNSGSANQDVYQTLIFGPDYLGESELSELDIVINEPGRASELKQYNTYGYRFVKTQAVIHAAAGVVIETSAQLGG